MKNYRVFSHIDNHHGEWVTVRGEEVDIINNAGMTIIRCVEPDRGYGKWWRFYDKQSGINMGDSFKPSQIEDEKYRVYARIATSVKTPEKYAQLVERYAENMKGYSEGRPQVQITKTAHV